MISRYERGWESRERAIPILITKPYIGSRTRTAQLAEKDLGNDGLVTTNVVVPLGARATMGIRQSVKFDARLAGEQGFGYFSTFRRYAW